MKTTARFVLAATLLLGVAACDSKENDPQPEAPAPAATFTMGSSIYYPSPNVIAAISYPSGDVQHQAILNDELLYVHFDAKEGRDAVNFTIERSQLTAAIIGTYTLKSMPNTESGAADVRYVYYRENKPGSISGSIYDSNNSHMGGQLTVTAYDAKRHLLSGSYEMRMENITDPTDASWDPTDKERCNLTLWGTFSNLPIQ
ncbi:hypothetical protein FY528_03195 [Hymenobacter lutimineralis]|uniref:Lipoprotein n=1 Tax=Hymenobacter lutimineralis TaxID=2606448 RepID=A0A5D6VFD4_9BACT|nr:MULTISPECIES: hypothetical protein [Hymenobacter]QIX61212.1 hypothetical protein HER32_08475 [Hymenobacter sp. BT18]TYZ13428.1 hypothetical protein FY528_03195 [Hymenobacter lutimineralis]